MRWWRRRRPPPPARKIPENASGVGFHLPPANHNYFDNHWRWIEYEDLELPDNLKWRTEHPEYDEIMDL